MSFTEILKKLGLIGREPDPDDPSEAGTRSVDNVDATTAARTQHGMGPAAGVGGIPPDYVKEYDEGRPRH